MQNSDPGLLVPDEVDVIFTVQSDVLICHVMSRVFGAVHV